MPSSLLRSRPIRSSSTGGRVAGQRIVEFWVRSQLPDASNNEITHPPLRMVHLRHDTGAAADDGDEVFQIMAAMVIAITSILKRGVLRREKCDGRNNPELGVGYGL
jgi:hypothetical protein